MNELKQINPKVELASGDYDRRKEKGIIPSVAVIARIHGIKHNQLRNYRANYISRKKPR
jgi:hypothetical protein